MQATITVPAWYLDQLKNEEQLRARCQEGFDRTWVQFQRGILTCEELIEQLCRIRHQNT